MSIQEPIVRPFPDSDGKRSWSERQRRRAQDLNRLALEAQSVLRALPHYQIKDCDFQDSTNRLRRSLGTSEVILIPVRGPRFSSVMIVIPMRVWHDAYLRKALWALRGSSMSADRPTIRLITQRWIRREPFLTNCKHVARYASFAVSATDRCSILKLVSDNPLATLEDCADAVRGPDPYGAVFALVSAGLLRMNFENAITPASAVEAYTVER